MGRPLVVGIAGGTASGKSTFSDRLEKELAGYRMKVFHMDSYFKEKGSRPYIMAPVTGVVYEDHNHPDTIDMAKLEADVERARDEELDLILVEGHLVLYWKPLCDKLDCKLYIDCQADERILRRLRRNTAWGQSFDEVTQVYLDAVRYRHDEFVEPSKWKADFILNGSQMSEKGIEAVTGWIRSKIG